MLTIRKFYVTSVVSAVVMCVGGLGCSGSSSPSSPSTTATTAAPATSSTTNGAPVINSVNVTPTFGVAALQEHAFTSGASDPDEDTLTYRWEDSAGVLLSEAASFNHTFGNLASTVTETITLTVQDADGLSTSSSVTVTAISLNGVWVAENRPSSRPGEHLFTVDLTMATGGAEDSLHGPTGLLTGTWQWPGTDIDSNPHQEISVIGPEGEPGTVWAKGDVIWRQKSLIGCPCADSFFTGSVNETGTVLAGEFNESGFNHETVRFVRP